MCLMHDTCSVDFGFVRLFARGASAQQGRHAGRIKDAQTDGCQKKKDHCVAYSLRQHFEVWLAN